MKTDRRNFLKKSGLIGAGLMIGCSRSKPSKSMDDLKIAYVREATTQEKYSKFAVKAKEENYPKIATMFNAISKAEGIHAANHQKVIKKLKGNYPNSPVGEFDVKSTLDNLQNGLQTETYEIQTMYPSFIKEAQAENQADAVNSFTWAYQVEIQHQGYYNLAITAFGTGSEVNFPGAWYVCPNCGGTYAKEDLKNTCYFDPTPKEQFFEFIQGQ
jgi:rubrerythrin